MAQKTADINPMGTDGFEFVEYTAPDPQLLRSLFERLGFPVVAQHRSKNVTLHSQGDINFVINAEQSLRARPPDSRRICLRTYEEGDRVHLEVEDSGPGV